MTYRMSLDSATAAKLAAGAWTLKERLTGLDGAIEHGQRL